MSISVSPASCCQNIPRYSRHPPDKPSGTEWNGHAEPISLTRNSLACILRFNDYLHPNRAGKITTKHKSNCFWIRPAHEGLGPLKSVPAGQHGRLRRQQGYTVPMVVEESRILQVSVFKTIHDNMRNVDFTHVMKDVVTIADEVDSQLKEQMVCFMESSISTNRELINS